MGILDNEENNLKKDQNSDKKFDLNKLKRFEFWLNKLGVVFLFLGVIFLFKYSFNYIDIPEEVKKISILLFGINLGIGMEVIAVKLRAKMTKFSQVLSGGAMAIIYASIYGGYQFFGFLPHNLTFILLSLLSVYCFFNSVKQNSVYLAFIAFAGGILTPTLLYNSHAILGGYIAYIFFLMLGIVIVYIYRGWNSLIWLSAIGGFLGVILYNDYGYSMFNKVLLQSEISAYWLILWLLPIIREILKYKNPEKWKISKDLSNKGEKYKTFFENNVYAFSVLSPLLIIWHTYILWEQELSPIQVKIMILVFASLYGIMFGYLKKIKIKPFLANIQLLVAINLVFFVIMTTFSNEITLIALVMQAIMLFAIGKYEKSDLYTYIADILMLIVLGMILDIAKTKILTRDIMPIEMAYLCLVFFTYSYREGDIGIVYRILIGMTGLILLATFPPNIVTYVIGGLSIAVFLVGKLIKNKNLKYSSIGIYGIAGIFYIFYAAAGGEIAWIGLWIYTIDSLARYIFTKDNEQEKNIYFILFYIFLAISLGRRLVLLDIHFVYIVLINFIILAIASFITRTKKMEKLNLCIASINNGAVFLILFLLIVMKLSGIYYINYISLGIAFYINYMYNLSENSVNNNNKLFQIQLGIAALFTVLKLEASIYYVLLGWILIKGYRVYFQKKKNDGNAIFHNVLLFIGLIIIVNINLIAYGSTSYMMEREINLLLPKLFGIKILTEYIFIIVASKVYFDLYPENKLKKYRYYVLGVLVYGLSYMELATVSSNMFLISAVWGTIGVASIIFGMLKRETGIFTAGVTGIILLALKSFLIDLRNLSEGYKIILFIVFGIVFLILSYYIQKYVSERE